MQMFILIGLGLLLKSVALLLSSGQGMDTGCVPAWRLKAWGGSLPGSGPHAGPTRRHV